MELQVKYRGKTQTVKTEKDRITAGELLKLMGLSPEYAFVVKNGELASEDEPVSPEDELKVVNAISGG
ncbi:MoaD/ThiS family protein [Persephonella sp.]